MTRQFRTNSKSKEPLENALRECNVFTENEIDHFYYSYELTGRNEPKASLQPHYGPDAFGDCPAEYGTNPYASRGGKSWGGHQAKAPSRFRAPRVPGVSSVHPKPVRKAKWKAKAKSYAKKKATISRR